VSTNEAAHTEGDLIWENEPYHWAQVDRPTADRVLANKTAPVDSIASRRLQAWVDRFDSAVRALVKEKTGRDFVAPKPEVRLIASSDINAYISFMPTCLAGKADAATTPEAGADGASEPFPLAVVPDMKRIVNGVDSSNQPIDCLQPTNWPAEQGKALAWFNRIGAIQVASQADAIEVSGADQFWQFPRDFSPVGKKVAVRRVGIAAALPYVNVYAPLVALLSETATAAIVAHELGHYYRAHLSTANVDRYAFWYDRAQHAAERPTPVENQRLYGDQYESVKAPPYLITGQKRDPRFGPTFLRWARELNVPSGHVCEPIQKAVAGWSPSLRANLLDRYTGTHDLTVEAKRAFLDLETAAAPCIDKVKLTDEPATATWGESEAPREWFLDRLSAPLIGTIDQGEQHFATLAELVSALDAKGKELGAAGDAFLANLEANHIGLYTAEQEADDLAMDLSSRLGLTPDQVLDGFLELARALEKDDPESFAKENNGLSMAKCEALYRKDFHAPDENGNDREVYVPLGSLFDPHHAFCYRIFNLSRERKVHAYEPGPKNFPEAAPPWFAIQTEAAKLAGLPAPRPPPDNGKPEEPGTKDDRTTSSAPGESSSAAGDQGESAPSPPSSHGPAPANAVHTETRPKASGCNSSSSGAGEPRLVVAGVAALAALISRRRSDRSKRRHRGRVPRWTNLETR
jgi:MYXO-CTERM domain-containing protein